MKVLLFLCALGLANVAFGSDSPVDAWAAAETAFEEGDDVALVNQYEALLRQVRVWDARVYRNLGKAYKRLGQLGEAAWAEAVAYRLAPREMDAVSLPGSSLVEKWRLGTLPGLAQLSAREVVWLALGLHLAFWGAMSAWFFRRRSPVLKRLSGGLALLWVLFAFFAGPRLYREWGETEVVVIAEGAVLFSSYVGGRSVGAVQAGERALVENTAQFSEVAEGKPVQWVWIRTFRGGEGWVPGDQVRLLSPLAFH